LIPITFDLSVNAGDKHVVSNVEFPFAVEERFIKILLDDVGSLIPLVYFLSIFNHIFNILQIFAYSDPIASVREFTRFNNPYIINFIFNFFGTILLLPLFFIIVL
jgi:hypothetical protein